MCCCAIAVLAVGATASFAQTQLGSGRALLIYKEGVTTEQEKKDRSACNEWAIQQSGFDPSAIFAAQQAGVRTRTIFEVAGAMDIATGGAAEAHHQRSDVCAVPASGVVAEAMVALVLANSVIEKFGGDSLGETRRNLDSYLAAIPTTLATSAASDPTASA